MDNLSKSSTSLKRSKSPVRRPSKKEEAMGFSLTLKLATLISSSSSEKETPAQSQRPLCPANSLADFGPDFEIRKMRSIDGKYSRPTSQIKSHYEV